MYVQRTCSKSKIRCRGEPRTSGGRVTLSVATADPPSPNSAPPRARIRQRLSIARSYDPSRENDPCLGAGGITPISSCNGPSTPADCLQETLYGMGRRDCSTLTLSMAERDFAEIQLDILETLSQLKRATDPKLRQKLLTQMRTLLAEADSVLLESAK